MGSSLPAVRIELRPQMITHFGLSLDALRSAIANSTTHLPKGVLQDNHQSWQVDDNGQLDQARDYRALIVSYQNGQAVRLGDVAQVEDSVEDKYNIGYYNQNRAVLIGVSRQAGANMLATIDAIKARLPALSASFADYPFIVARYRRNAADCHRAGDRRGIYLLAPFAGSGDSRSGVAGVAHRHLCGDVFTGLQPG
jgi:multidrug efflux pump subunit AcrB